jgi:hypothetical protein
LGRRGRRHGVGDGRSRRVVGRRSGVGGEVSQSLRFSAPLIGLRSLGFVGALWARRTLVPMPWLAPFYCGAAREGAHCHTRQAPPIRARIGSVSRSGDPEITFLTFSPLISISYLYLDNPLIHKSVHRTHCILTVSYVLSDTMITIHISVSKQILV